MTTESWLLPTLAMLPVLLGVFLLAGVPWTLLILPVQDRRDRVLTGTVGLALGAVIVTAIMFLLGTFGTITAGGTLVLTALLAAVGAVLAWWQARRNLAPQAAERAPLARWEWLAVAGIGLVLAVQVVRVAYWPFAAYDPLWVYGYNARIFTLSGHIPATMGYYPQMLPLSYTLPQLLWGGINDHAARAAIPVFGLISTGAAYVLGARLGEARLAPTKRDKQARSSLNPADETPTAHDQPATTGGQANSGATHARRLGLLTALLWTFYPHHLDWARFGDLEIPLTAFFTLSALFFLLAWRTDSRDRWRYAVLSGLMLGGALWTKPTAGALVWGIGLVLLAAVIQARGRLSAIWPRWWLVVTVGIASAPVGGMWYVRNILLGHPALVFPPAYWLTQSQRSGQQFRWPLLALMLLIALLLLRPRERRPDARLLLGGLALVLIGLLPTSGLPNALLYPAVTRRMAPLEIAALLAGIALIGLALVQISDTLLEPREAKTDEQSGLIQGRLHKLAPGRWWRAADVAVTPTLRTAGLIGLLALPYWVTWFWSYSYHPRLAFAMTPLLLYVIALLVEGLINRLAERVPAQAGRRLVHATLVVAALGGAWLTMVDTTPHLVTNDLADDNAKQLASNYALTRTVNALRADIASSDRPARIVAPGALRLPFFFPTVPVITDPVTDLGILDEGVTYFIDGFESENAYNSIGQGVNPVRGAMGLPWLAEPISHEWDGDFFYDLYRVDTARRHSPPEFNGVLDPTPIYDGFAEVLGFSMTGREFWPGRRIVLNIVFHVLGDVDTDYTIYLHVLDDDDTLIAAWDHDPGSGQYLTSLWEPGEYIEDRTWVDLGADVPPGTYRVVMGLYDRASGQRLPVQVGATTTDGFVLVDYVTMLEAPPE